MNPVLLSLVHLDLEIHTPKRSFFVLGKYSYLDVASGTLPWMANNNSRKWFVVCVLEAWSQSGAFKPDLVATLYETLKSYYETISTGTETTREVSIVWYF